MSSRSPSGTTSGTSSLPGLRATQAARQALASSHSRLLLPTASTGSTKTGLALAAKRMPAPSRSARTGAARKRNDSMPA